MQTWKFDSLRAKKKLNYETKTIVFPQKFGSLDKKKNLRELQKKL